MKKYFLLFLILFFPMMVFAEDLESNHLQDVTKEESTAITVERLKEIDISEGMGGSQGIDVTDQYIIISQSPSENEGSTENSILVYNKDSLEYVKTISHNVGHGNDVCYNSDTKEIIIVQSSGGKMIFHIFNSDTLEFKKDVELSTEIVTGGHAVTYNPSKNQYIVAQGNVGFILDKDLNLVSKFDITIDQVKQSMEYHAGYIYYSNYEKETVEYTRKFEAYTGVIYVFDATGKYKNTVYIPQIGTDKVELEGTAIDTNGETYFLYNNHTSHKIEIYKATFSPENTLQIEIPVRIVDAPEVEEEKYSFSGIFYKEEQARELPTTILTTGGNPAIIPITLEFNNIGTFVYYFEQVATDSNPEIQIDSEPLKVTIINRYILSKNKVQASYKLDRAELVNSVAVDPPTVIDNVPDTNRGHSILYIIMGVFVGIIGFVIVLSTKEKKVEL